VDRGLGNDVNPCLAGKPLTDYGAESRANAVRRGMCVFAHLALGKHADTAARMKRFLWGIAWKVTGLHEIKENR
jgi:hypothetical protein